jgi:hemerythrin
MLESPIMASELVTGVAIIDAEHLRLRQLIGQLREICSDFEMKDGCQGCGLEKTIDCERKLLDSLMDILGFMTEHFVIEERLLKGEKKSTDEKDRFALHVEDHIGLIEKLTAVATAKDLQHTVRQIAETATVLDRWLTDHIKRFDVPMLQ